MNRTIRASDRMLALLVVACMGSLACHAQPVADAMSAVPSAADVSNQSRKRNVTVLEDGAAPAAVPAKAQRPGFDLDLQFENGSARIREEGRQLLAMVANSLKSPGHQLSYFMIESYTDEMGSAARNLKLSQERADAVRRALIAAGVAPTRLVAAGRGAGSPEDAAHAVGGRRLRVVHLD